MLETFVYPGLADRWFQSELLQQLDVIFIGSLSLYCTQREGVLRVLQCTVQYKRRHTVYGRTNRHIAGRLRLAGQSRCESVRWLIWAAVTITSKTRRSSRFTRIYVSLYFCSFWADFSQTTFTSSCKIVHFIKSDNQFPSISQNN